MLRIGDEALATRDAWARCVRHWAPMKRFAWPRSKEEAIAIPPADHPHTLRVANQILDHARAGRTAFAAGRFAEAKYQRDCCSLLLWRLSVDGLTADGQLRMDAAKWETRLAGRLSSEAARRIREGADLRNRSQSALATRVAPDHIVPRNCVAEVLVRPEWLDLNDAVVANAFVISHAEIAVLSPQENAELKAKGFESRMPERWWDAEIADKALHRFGRYEAANIVVTPWRK